MINAITLNSLKNISLENNLLKTFEGESKNLTYYTIIKLKSGKNSFVANYRLPEDYKNWIGIEVSDYLENFDINLKDKKYKELTIYKIFNNWPKCGEHIKEVSLKKYFEEDFDDLDFLSQPPSIVGLKQAEDWFLDKIVDYKKMKAGYYLPVPYEENGQFLGMIYLIYDRIQMEDDDLKIIDDFRRKLVKKYSE